MAEMAFSPEEVELLHNDLQNSEAENRRLRRQVTALKNELKRQRKEHPRYDAAKRLFDLWFEKLGKRSNTIFDERREKTLLAMLDAYEARGIDGEGLMHLAILGLSKKPYVGPRGRQSTPGPGAKRFDDLKYAVQDAESVERFMAYAEEETTPVESEAPVERVTAPITTQRVHELGRRFDGAPRDYNCFPKLIQALEDHGCTVRGSGARYSSQCPAHEDRDPSLSIREKDDGKILIHCHAGCETVDVLSAIGLDFVHLMGVEAA